MKVSQNGFPLNNKNTRKKISFMKIRFAKLIVISMEKKITMMVGSNSNQNKKKKQRERQSEREENTC